MPAINGSSSVYADRNWTYPGPNDEYQMGLFNIIYPIFGDIEEGKPYMWTYDDRLITL